LSAAAISTPTVIGWCVTACGIIASLGWNLVNYHRSTKTAERLRNEQYVGSQWARIRTRIEKSLDGLVDASRLVVRQADELADDTALSASVNMFHRIIVDAQDELSLALEEADLSKYCDGRDWAAKANGPLVGTETSWDRVLLHLSEASSAADRAACITSLSRLKSPVTEIRQAVQECCRIQDLMYDPSPRI
jgi:hypothetical protein